MKHFSMIRMRQIERISAGETDFSREFPLGSAIPFPERMEGVEVPVVFCQDIHKPLFISRSTFALRIVCLEDAVRITWNILYEAEQVSFSDIDRTRFSCPIIKFLKKSFMNLAEMVKVEIALYRFLLQRKHGDRGVFDF